MLYQNIPCHLRHGSSMVAYFSDLNASLHCVGHNGSFCTADGISYYYYYYYYDFLSSFTLRTNDLIVNY